MNVFSPHCVGVDNFQYQVEIAIKLGNGHQNNFYCWMRCRIWHFARFDGKVGYHKRKPFLRFARYTDTFALGFTAHIRTTDGI